ncbi:MAG TPA: hypothetical protein PLW48_05985 [Alphaproteobacteria bacterium]|nr:hypothetical protein [Alphaproteobacteria bacterium]
MWNKHICKIALLAALFTVTSSVDAHAGQKLGDVLINVKNSWGGLTGILSTIAYIFGCILAITGIFKFKDHVDNPAQTKLSEGIKRMLAGGMFLSLPFAIRAVRGSLFETAAMGDNKFTNSGFTNASLSAGGLDKMVVDVMSNIAGPAEVMLTAFTYIAAIGLLLVGISRLTKRVEEGPRGPGGAGTITTFLASGALFSFGDSMGTFANSVFGTGGNALKTTSLVSNTVITDTDDRERIQTVIEGVMVFVMLVGYIAFIRGWFVLRAFADGQQGATVAQGLTFLFGGTLAINLGELINVIMRTANVTGLSFT